MGALGPNRTVSSANAALGTIATHLAYAVSCRAGVRSCHFFECCHANKEARRARDRAVAWFWRLTRCPSCSLAEVLEDLRKATLAVLASGLESLHDSPYSFLAPELHAAGVRLFLTSRRPIEWAVQRLRATPFLPDPICRQPPYFDFVACAPRVLAGNRSATTADAFTTDANATSLAAKFGAHQRELLALGVFEFTAWDADVRDRLRRAASFFAHPDDPAAAATFRRDNASALHLADLYRDPATRRHSSIAGGGRVS